MRNETSQVTAQIDLSDDASTTIRTGPTRLYGVYVNVVMSAHAIELEDVAATPIFTIPASTAAGTLIRFPGVLFPNALILNPATASTGMVSVMYEKA